MRHIISVLVENEPGALSRLVGLFSQRGYNIETLNVAPTEDSTLSRLTLTTYGNEHKIEQITKQLNKLIDVIRVADYIDCTAVERELALIKVAAEPEQRAQILQLVEIFRARVIDVGERDMLIEMTGGCEKVDAFANLMDNYGIREMARTGVIAMARGHKTA